MASYDQRYGPRPLELRPYPALEIDGDSFHQNKQSSQTPFLLFEKELDVETVINAPLGSAKHGKGERQ